HQAKRAEALRHCVRLHVAVVVLASPDIAAVPFQHTGDHVVDQPVLVRQAALAELRLELVLVDRREDVHEVAIIGLQDGVLGGEVQRPAAHDGVVEAGAGEPLDRHAGVVHGHDHAVARAELMHLQCLHRAAVGRLKRQCRLAWAGDLHLHRAVDVAIGMPPDNDRLRPVRHQPGHVLANDRLAEKGAVQNVARRAVRAAIHPLQVEFLHPGVVRGDRRARHADAVLRNGVGGIDRNLVVGLIAVFDAQTGGPSRVMRISGGPSCCRSCGARSAMIIGRPDARTGRASGECRFAAHSHLRERMRARGRPRLPFPHADATRRRLCESLNSAETSPARRGASMSDLEIVWTKVDEAPALATYSLLPIVEAFTGMAGVTMKLKDISLTGRILANFPEKLTQAQRINDELAELGQLAMRPEANIIKLPNISASIPQLKAAIKELQGKGYDVPDYPDNAATDTERDIRSRYGRVLGSAVNPVLREGNSDRRAAGAVKQYARDNPHKMGAWSADSKSHVAYMSGGDFYGSEVATTVAAGTNARIEWAGADGAVTVLKAKTPLLAGEIIDASATSREALRAFYAEQIEDARKQGVLFSLHLKATMMKISDPIVFGHCVAVFFADVFRKHAATLARIGVDPDNGMADLLTRIETLPDAEKAAIKADIAATYAQR